MITIGLIGGIASGKSTVAQMFEQLGAAVLDADRAAHEVLDRPEVQSQLVERWGSRILDSHGQTDRSVLSNLVFGDSDTAVNERSFLESIVHPLARKSMEDQRAKLANSGLQIFVIDAPLLFEAGWDSVCDFVVMVDAPLERRLENATMRGWTADELTRRERNQLDLATKRARSDFLINNGGTIAETRQSVEELWQKLSNCIPEK